QVPFADVPSAARSPAGLPRPTGAASLALSELATLSGGVLAGPDARISGITASSDQVRPGDLFAGVPGRSGHGVRFAADALRAGAVGVLTDVAGRPSVPPGVPVLVVDDVRAALGPVAATVYGRPSRDLAVLGVTGTTGK